MDDANFYSIKDDGLDLPSLDLGDISLDLGAFDLGDCPIISNRYVKPRLYRPVTQHAVKYDRAREFVRDCGPKILGGHRIDALVSGNFIFGDFFEAFAVEADILIDDLTISTLALSQDNIDSLRNLMRGDYVQSLGLIVSDFFWSHNRHNAAYIYNALDIADRFQLAVAGTHTKIALMAFGGNKIVIHGSANLRSSRSVETFTVEKNPDLYDFHMEWHRAILERYATVNKSVRAEKLFSGITEGVWE